MKKVLLVAILSGLIGSLLPATPALATPPVQAAGKRFVFPQAGTVPCATVLCDYWPAVAALGNRPCESPFPPQTYVDFVTQVAPTVPAGKKMILDFQTSPVTDWDTWICGLLNNGDPTGGELAQGANILGQLCDNFLGPDSPVPVGCVEEAQAPAEAGHQYVLRAYNYSDAQDDPAIYNWVLV
jgi:hypothetical protein